MIGRNTGVLKCAAPIDLHAARLGTGCDGKRWELRVPVLLIEFARVLITAVLLLFAYTMLIGTAGINKYSTRGLRRS